MPKLSRFCRSGGILWTVRRFITPLRNFYRVKKFRCVSFQIAQSIESDYPYPLIPAKTLWGILSGEVNAFGTNYSHKLGKRKMHFWL